MSNWKKRKKEKGEEEQHTYTLKMFANQHSTKHWLTSKLLKGKCKLFPRFFSSIRPKQSNAADYEDLVQSFST